ncbi:retrovirus-related pol polyprotein from transposon TNT 1-94 [Tanacetum coccineum]
MQGTSLTKQERECKLNDEFDKFTYKKGESLHEYYLRFTLLLNDMNIYKMPLEQFQVNTKFLNTLPAEWSKFVTNHGDDLIDAINHVMSFLSAVVTSRYPTTNNQLRNSSNPRQQATINDGRVTVQPVQGRQISYVVGTTRTFTPGASGSNLGKQMIVTCYNCKGEGHMSKQCTKPRRKRDDSWFKDKVLLFQAQASGQILHEEELAFLADPGILEDALAEVHNHDNVNNNMINRAVQVMPSFEQSNIVNHSETEITSDSNIIPYSQYQLKTQVANYTKINLENKSVNDTLTDELERYKEQFKVLNEGQNVDLKSKDNISDSCAQSVEIDHLKQTLSEHLKEKESLMQMVTLLKNDFKKEESRNIDREIALEKRIKQLDNILEPKLYVGDIIEKTNAIVIPDSEETLMLAEESHSKMLLKQKDHIIRPTIVEVPKELPKVSMVNTSLKKLKHHLAGFNVVVKERTTPTAITEGSWGFEHTKACFRDEIIPFVKALKDLFNTFNQYLVDELSEVQNVFHQMEQAVEQHRLESKTFEVKMNQVLNENERLLEQVISKDIVNILVNSSVNIASVNVHEFIKKLKERIKALSGKQNEDKIKKDLEEIETINIELDHRVTKLIAENEHLKQTYKQLYDSIKPACIRSKEQCDDLINQVNLKSVEISDLNASLQEKVLVITALKNDLRKLKGKALVDNDVTKHPSDPEMLKIDVEPITPKLLNKQTAHSAYIKHTQEEATVLRDLVEHVKSKYPLDQSLESACRYAKLVQELLTNISKTCPSINNADGKLVAVTPKNKDKSVRFTEPVTSSGYTITKIDYTSNIVSNKPMLSSTGVKPSTSASRS